MTRSQLETIYINSGLNDFRLKDVNDLLDVHSIDCEAVRGYQELLDENKALYKKFIVNFFNAQGLDSRIGLIPKGIYFVEENTYYLEEHRDGEVVKLNSGEVVYRFMENGKKVLHKKSDYYPEPEYKDLPRHFSSSSKYLRIEYIHNKRKEWLHIKNDREWY